MRRYVEFQLQDGSTIFVEVDVSDDEWGVTQVSREHGVIAKAQMTFEDAMDKVKPAASAIIKKLRDLSDSPNTIEVQFGLKMSAEAGAVIAVAGIEANYTVTLKWERKENKRKSKRAEGHK